MKKCPYCFEVLEEKPSQCPHCNQFIIDPIVEVDYKSLDKKKCVFCGKNILAEAKVCKHCRRWLDDVDGAVEDFDKVD